MARRSSRRLPLYELIRTRPVARPRARPEEGEPLPAVERDPLGATIGPGRTLRVPAGYLLLAFAVVVALVTVAYVAGYSRAERILTAEFDAERFALAAGQGGAEDPLARPEATLPPPETRSPPPATSVETTGTWGPIEPRDDPRTPGLNYFVIMATRPDGARRVAEFCREHGLEAYVVPANNPSLREVIAFPGFEYARRSSPEVKDLGEMIEEIGERWRRREGSASGFGAYPSLYRP